MILNENVTKWSSIISESLGVSNKQKLNWMSQYAANHEVFEGLQNANAAVDGGIYATPLNTIGMGNPNMPYNATTPGAPVGTPGGAFGNQKVGSGDIPMSTLTMSLEIAAMTIGLELVPVIPANGPWAMLSYMDFPYAGGKLGLINETSLDGKGAGAQNKPIYIKVKCDSTTNVAAKANKAGDDILFCGKKGTIVGTFIGNSRIDNGIIVKVEGIAAAATNAVAESYTFLDSISIADVFEGKITVIGVTGATVDEQDAVVDLVNGAADHVQGFSNFATGSDDPMSRAENETGVGNTIGARMFTKLVQMGSYEVTGAVTRQQLQDMPLYGVDVIGKVLEAMQNEISQAINNRILDRLFKLGVDNAKLQHDYQGVDLNLFFGTAGAGSTKDLNKFGAAKFMKDSDGKTDYQTGWTVKNAIQNTAAENVYTHQRRIYSRVMAAANLIANVSRFGRGSFIVTNTQVLSALQDCAGFVVAPMTNTLTQDGSNSLYFAGSIAGLNVYVDPYMTWDDTRILVGRKSDGNTPGVIFMPYILADTVQTVVEGTMAPKLLVNSRFAIVEAGFHPQLSYFTFAVESDGAYLL
jgi:hypothetical protein